MRFTGIIFGCVKVDITIQILGHTTEPMHNTKISHCSQFSVEKASKDKYLEHSAASDREKLDNGARRNAIANLSHDCLQPGFYLLAHTLDHEDIRNSLAHGVQRFIYVVFHFLRHRRLLVLNINGNSSFRFLLDRLR